MGDYLGKMVPLINRGHEQIFDSFHKYLFNEGFQVRKQLEVGGQVP